MGISSLNYCRLIIDIWLPAVYRNLITHVLGAMLSYSLRVNMSVAVGSMKDDLGWTETQKGGYCIVNHCDLV